MPGAKDFTKCTLEAVKDPGVAKDAISDKPGEKQKPPGAGQKKAGSSSSAAGGGSATPEQSNGEPQPALTWVGVHLVDDEGKDVPGQRYTIKLPDGTTAEGVTDDEGKAKYEAVQDGSVEISFPDIHGDEWNPA